MKVAGTSLAIIALAVAAYFVLRDYGATREVLKDAGLLPKFDALPHPMHHGFTKVDKGGKAVDNKALPSGKSATQSGEGEEIVHRFVPAAKAPDSAFEGIKVFTADELINYDGRDPNLPLLLVIIGEVYDVTSGSKFYQKDSGYNIFIGKEQSRAFHSGKFESFDPAESDVRTLDPVSLLDVTGWRSFFRTHKDGYRFVGVMEGLYFDANGRPTEALHTVERMEETGRTAQAVEERVLKEISSCSMKYDGVKKWTDMWCEPKAGQSDARFPRLLTWVHVGTGNQAKRCVCVTRGEIEGSVPLAETVPGKRIEKEQLSRYEQCGEWDSKCGFAVN